MKKAMIDAGYSESYADRNSKYLLGIIGQDLKDEQSTIKNAAIKSVAEIQKWWSSNMDNPELTWGERLKNSEMLARSQGVFLDQIKIDVPKKLEELL